MARITVVDDDDDFLALMQDLLDTEGHEATVVKEPVDSNELAATEPEVLIIDVRPGDIRLLDDGWALVVGSRSHPHLREVPVIICSTDVPEHRERAEVGRQLPGVYLLEKPFSLSDLEALLARLLPR